MENESMQDIELRRKVVMLLKDISCIDFKTSTLENVMFFWQGSGARNEYDYNKLIRKLDNPKHKTIQDAFNAYLDGEPVIVKDRNEI